MVSFEIFFLTFLWGIMEKDERLGYLFFTLIKTTTLFLTDLQTQTLQNHPANLIFI